MHKLIKYRIIQAEVHSVKLIITSDHSHINIKCISDQTDTLTDWCLFFSNSQLKESNNVQ